jgi:hypothetical protein
MIATHEFVVPKSIPIILEKTICYFYGTKIINMMNELRFQFLSKSGA